MRAHFCFSIQRSDARGQERERRKKEKEAEAAAKKAKQEAAAAKAAGALTPSSHTAHSPYCPAGGGAGKTTESAVADEDQVPLHLPPSLPPSASTLSAGVAQGVLHHARAPCRDLRRLRHGSKPGHDWPHLDAPAGTRRLQRQGPYFITAIALFFILTHPAVGCSVWLRTRVHNARGKGNSCFLVLRSNM